MKVFLIVPSLLILLLPIEQQPVATIEQQLQERVEQKTPASLYAMKITFQKEGEAAPMFVLIRDIGGRLRGGFAQLRTDRMMRTSVPENERASSIEGSVEQVGDKWSITFSVLVGPRVDQDPQRIASYQLDLGETAVVTELSKFQIEPFSVSIVKISPVRALQPVVINDTSSIEVTRVVVSDVPTSYRITLKNLSNKPVRALRIETLSGVRSMASAHRRGSWDQPLIDTQGSYETQLSSNTGSYRKIAPNEYEPSQAEKIRVGGVLFSDWTYEGEPLLAATEVAIAIGEGLQIKRALKLFEAALANPGSAPQDLIASVGMLQNEVSSSDLGDLKDKFPTLNSPEVKLLYSAIMSSRNVKTDLISEIQGFQAESAAPNGVDFQTWLKREKAKYEKWLSTLP